MGGSQRQIFYRRGNQRSCSMVHSLGNCLTSKPGKYMKIYGCALDFHQIKSNNVQLCLVLPTGGFDRIKFQPFQPGVGPLPVSGFLGGVPCAVGSLKSELRHATEMFNSRQKKQPNCHFNWAWQTKCNRKWAFSKFSNNKLAECNEYGNRLDPSKLHA